MSNLFRDNQIGWKRQVQEIPARWMAGMLSSAGADASQGTGAAAHSAIGLTGAELTCVQMEVNDEIYHFMRIPTCWDMNHVIKVGVNLIHSATGADTPIFSVSYKLLGVQDTALVDAVASADEKVTFAAHTCSTTDDSIEETNFYATAIHTNYASTDKYIALALVLDDAGSASAGELEVMSLLIEYQPSFCIGTGRGPNG